MCYLLIYYTYTLQPDQICNLDKGACSLPIEVFCDLISTATNKGGVRVPAACVEKTLATFPDVWPPALMARATVIPPSANGDAKAKSIKYNG